MLHLPVRFNLLLGRARCMVTEPNPDGQAIVLFNGVTDGSTVKAYVELDHQGKLTPVN